MYHETIATDDPPKQTPTRQKSSPPSKRRCDLGIPKCSRSIEKSPPCTYQTPPSILEITINPIALAQLGLGLLSRWQMILDLRI
jgi:hypothetical protein